MAEPCFITAKDVHAVLTKCVCESLFTEETPGATFDRESFDCIRKLASGAAAASAKNAGYDVLVNVDDTPDAMVDPVLKQAAIYFFVMYAYQRAKLQIPAALEATLGNIASMIHTGEMPLLCEKPDPASAVGGVCFSKKDHCKPKRSTVMGGLKYEL